MKQHSSGREPFMEDLFEHDIKEGETCEDYGQQDTDQRSEGYTNEYR